MTVFPLSASVASTALRLRFWAATAMALASGCLLAATYSLQPLWWAAWLAPMPVLAAALAGARHRGRLLGALAGLVAGSTTFSYYELVAGWPVAVLLLGLRAVFWSAAVAASARAARGLPAYVAVWALPLFGAGVETAVMALSPHGSAGSLAYSQMEFPLLIQAASLGGVPAVVFLVLCGGSLMGLVAGRLMGASLSWRELGSAALAVGVVLGAALCFSVVRLSRPEMGPQVSVVLLSTPRPARPPVDWVGFWRIYGRALSASARPGVIIVVPEGSVRLAPEAVFRMEAEIAEFARTRRVTLVIGTSVESKQGSAYNRAVIAQPNGRVLRYDKRRLVPGAEARFTPGRTPLLTDVGGVRVGLAICKDMHFPQLGREYGQAGAQLMLVPAWDFVRDAWLSDRLTALRGVESGYAIARATREGISSLSDRYGRNRAEMGSAGGVIVLSARMQLDRPDPPLYARIGDVFGWCCLFASAGVSVLGRRRRASGRGDGRKGTLGWANAGTISPPWALLESWRPSPRRSGTRWSVMVARASSTAARSRC